METQYLHIPLGGLEYHEASWIGIGFNSGKSVTIPAGSQESRTFWTNCLKGCVATIINLEHDDGDHTIAMSHFAHYDKEGNRAYLKALLNSLEHENKLRTIKKASCILNPPGIYKSSWFAVPGLQKNRELIAIFDEVWKQIIVGVLREKIPSITFEISPYLLNEVSSTVRYSCNSSKASGLIINRSSVIDENYKQLLMLCQNYQPNSIINGKNVTVAALGIAILGSYIYYTKKYPSSK